MSSLPQASTSLNSPDTLPQKYTVDQLKNYILRQLGSPIWTVEMSDQQVLDAIQDSLSLYSIWCPIRKYTPIRLTRTKHMYLTDEDNGLGVTDVQFLAPSATPGAIFYANLIDPSPIIRTGMDELDNFYRWRKTFQRVTAVEPDWLWQESENTLYIHNPIERYSCAVQRDFPYTDTLKLPLKGSVWVRQYSLAAANYLYGGILAKYQGAIPGPVGNITLDQGKREQAQAKMDVLQAQLEAMQETTPMKQD